MITVTNYINKLQSVSVNFLQTFGEKNYSSTFYDVIMTSLTIIIQYQLSNKKYSIRHHPYPKTRTTSSIQNIDIFLRLKFHDTSVQE